MATGHTNTTAAISPTILCASRHLDNILCASLPPYRTYSKKTRLAFGVMQGPLVGVLALQGAFEEHQKSLEHIGCRTVQVSHRFVVCLGFLRLDCQACLKLIVLYQVRTPEDLQGIDGLVLPGGESTAIGLIGTTMKSRDTGKNMWNCLQDFCQTKPTWGTCAGMILLAEKCVGASAVIQDGQALIGGIDITVCRNYFGSQVASFELSVPIPPGSEGEPFPGIFIRAPAILHAGSSVTVLGRVTAKLRQC